MNPAPPDISVVIGTSDRPACIRRLLDSLLAQDAPAGAFDVFVMDNSRSDDTERLFAERYASHPHLRYVRMEIVSGNVARNRGTRMADGAIVAFIDDDAAADPGWISAIRNAFATGGKETACVGGPSDLGFDVPPPPVSPWLLPFWGKLRRGDAPERLPPDAMLFGLNMAFRKEALIGSGLYDDRLERGSRDLASNNEYPMQVMLERAGYARRYIPAMRVTHYVLPERLNSRWMFRRAYWQGVSDVRLRRGFGIRRPAAFRRMRGSGAEMLGILLPCRSNAVLFIAWTCLCAGRIAERMGIARSPAIAKTGA